MKINELRAKKSKLVKEMRQMAEVPELSADQETRFDAMKTELEGIEKRIERAEYLDELDRTAETTETHPEYDREVRQYSLTRAIAGAAGLNVDDGREREISAELSRRSGRTPQGIFVPMDMPIERREWTGISTTAPAAGAGSNITPVDFRPGMFIDALRAKLVIRQLGCTVLSGLSGTLEIPKKKASGTAYWVAENDAVTASDLQFEKVTLNMRTAGALTEISRQMLVQSSPDVQQLVVNDFSAILAQAVDLAALQGAGSGSDQPLGLFEMATLNEVDVSDGWTWAAVLSFIEELGKDNVTGNAWVSRAEVVKTLRTTPKETAIYIADPGDAEAVSADYLMAGPNELAGYPLIATQNVPANQICFGNWSDLLLGLFGPLDLLVNPYEASAYSKGNIMVRMMLSCDTAVRHPESFCIADLGGE